MHQSFVTPGSTYGDGQGKCAGNDLLSSPAVPGKCRACDIAQIHPCEVYSYKEQVPALQGF